MENGLIPACQYKGPDLIEKKTTSQFIWQQLRTPFLLPPGGCVKCVDWEAIEFGCMGCLICGNFHVCSERTCHVTEIESHHVCNITGAVVRSVTYDQTEYLTTVVFDTPTTNKRNPTHEACMQHRALLVVPNKRSTVSSCLNFHERVCLQVLLSPTTEVCSDKERLKLHNRLRWSFMRHIRALKMERRQESPNLVLMISKIAGDIENYRLPITNETTALRRHIAIRCANDIFKFTSSMVNSKAVFTHTIDPTTMVIGLLYLLRSGLVHQNITILPQYRELGYLLPPENFIHLLHVKSKIITITENIVKCHLRTLSDTELKDIGYESIDHVI